jgi:hypothetical protein
MANRDAKDLHPELRKSSQRTKDYFSASGSITGVGKSFFLPNPGKGKYLGTRFWYSAYAGYLEAEISSLKSELPLKRMISSRIPAMDPLIQLPGAAMRNR